MIWSIIADKVSAGHFKLTIYYIRPTFKSLCGEEIAIFSDFTPHINTTLRLQPLVC